GAGDVAVGGGAADVLLELLVRQQQVDAGVPCDGLEARERGPDRLGLAVRDHGDAANRLRQLRLRSTRRGDRQARAPLGAPDRGTAPGSPSDRARLSLRRRAPALPRQAPPRPPPAPPARGRPDRGPRPSPPPPGRPRTAASRARLPASRARRAAAPAAAPCARR